MVKDVVASSEGVALAGELTQIETREQLDSRLMRSLYVSLDEYRLASGGLASFYDGVDTEAALDGYRANLGLALRYAEMIGDTYFSDQPEEDYLPGVIVFSNMALWEGVAQNVDADRLGAAVHEALTAFFSDANNRQERIQNAHAAIEMEVMRHAGDDLPAVHSDDALLEEARASLTDESLSVQVEPAIEPAQTEQDKQKTPKPRPKRIFVEVDESWKLEAKCRDTDVNFFYSDNSRGTSEAKKFCGGCAVKAECLETALANRESFGVWGGESERGRRKILKQRLSSK